RRVTAVAGGGEARESDVAWSPDGKSLAFLSDAGRPNQRQVWVSGPGSGAPRRGTTVTGQLADPKWAPDGRSIAFLFVEGSTQEPGALVAYRPHAGGVQEKVREPRVASVDLPTGKVHFASPPNLYVYDYDWSPDGTELAAEAAEGSGTNNYWIAQLYVVRADGGGSRAIWKPALQIACPRYSPDGRSIALIHGIMS